MAKKNWIRRYARRDVAERFWEKVDKTGECWIWTAARDENGYGVFGLEYRTPKAHRVAWALTNGPIPDGLDVLHSCDNPPCVNPAHLRPGTEKDNAQDMVSRGRHYSPFGDPLHRPAINTARWGKRGAV